MGNGKSQLGSGQQSPHHFLFPIHYFPLRNLYLPDQIFRDIGAICAAYLAGGGEPVADHARQYRL